MTNTVSDKTKTTKGRQNQYLSVIDRFEYENLTYYYDLDMTQNNKVKRSFLPGFFLRNT